SGVGSNQGSRYAIGCLTPSPSSSRPRGYIWPMLKTLLTKVFGTRFDREVKKIQPIVDAIKRHEADLKSYSDDQLKAQTPTFRARIAERSGDVLRELEETRKLRHDCADPAERDKLDGTVHTLEEKYKKELKQTLDDLLPEAFATVREACRRL